MSEKTCKCVPNASLIPHSHTYSIQINNRTLQVQPPEREKITVETIDKMGDVRKIIGQVSVAYRLLYIHYIYVFVHSAL